MKIKPIRNDRLSDKVVKEILTMIQDGYLKPGDKLQAENFLAEQLGVSRGILREALTILQAQGYIRRKPKDGTYIMENMESEFVNRSIADILKKSAYRDLLEFRDALEVKMVEKVIERASDEDIEDIFDILKAVENEDFSSNIDYYFHYKLAQLSRNTFFMNFIDTYFDLIAEIAIESLKNSKRQQEAEKEHFAIVKAIKDRDKEAARKAVKEHMAMVYKNVMGIK